MCVCVCVCVCVCFLWKCLSYAMLMNYLVTLHSSLQVGLPKTQNRLDKPVCFTHTLFS